MKKITAFFLSALAFWLTSCETDFDMIADYEDITIVYGLLNQNDSIHYIKINKAFLGDGNLLDYAAIQDSNIYPEGIEVILKEYDNSHLTRQILLDTVTIHDKNPGDFFYPDQIMYSNGTEHPFYLNENYTYEVEIYNPRLDKTITGSTILVNDFSLEKPRLNSLTYPTIYYADNDDPQTIEWYSARNGRRYQVVVDFEIKEFTQNGDSAVRYITWDSFPIQKSLDTEGGDLMSVAYVNEDFFAFVDNFIPYEDADKEAAIKKRIAQQLHFQIIVAADEFDTYMEVYEPNDNLVQSVPDYTNIENGIGLFSSRYIKTRSLYLHKTTLELLAQREAKFADPNLR
jgi:hypothetical protein